jgi:hypothetical protein
MTRFNWDRVRSEAQIRRYGSIPFDAPPLGKKRKKSKAKTLRGGAGEGQRRPPDPASPRAPAKPVQRKYTKVECAYRAYVIACIDEGAKVRT